MKLAVAGKGGSGKTALVALLSRAFSERARMVLAIDLDPNPGLALALGVPPEDEPLPERAVERRPGAPYGWDLAARLTPADAVRRYAVVVSERILFLGSGNMAGLDSVLHRYITAVRQVARDFDEPGWVVIADLAAGPTNPYEGYARFASLTLLTAEANQTSLMTARRLRDVIAHDGTPAALVATKINGPHDLMRVRQLAEPLGSIPFDPEMKRLARLGSLQGLRSDSPALDGARRLAAQVDAHELAGGWPRGGATEGWSG